eukprot:4542291-Prymnesium_polylepis.1
MPRHRHRRASSPRGVREGVIGRCLPGFAPPTGTVSASSSCSSSSSNYPCAGGSARYVDGTRRLPN